MPALSDHRSRELLLPDLVEAAAELLQGHTPSDERVTPVPDVRTVRYYQSLGILDRPLRYDGRRAVYGFRHLCQVVATKLLQGQGYSLSQVQTALSGRTTDQLAAAVSEAVGAPVPAPPPPSAPPPPRPLVAVEVAPGITVNIDPSRVDDPDAVVRRIAAALAGGAP